MDWWLAEVRHQFGDDWSDPDAPMLPSERHDPDLAGAAGSATTRCAGLGRGRPPAGCRRGRGG